MFEFSHQLGEVEDGPAAGEPYGYDISEGVVNKSVKLAMSEPSATSVSKKGDVNSGKAVSLNKSDSHSGGREGLPRKMDLGSAISVRKKSAPCIDQSYLERIRHRWSWTMEQGSCLRTLDCLIVQTPVLASALRVSQLSAEGVAYD